MREAGITSADLAEAISRDRAVVSRILNGHQMLKTDQAEKFADALKLPLQDVVDHAGLFSRTTAHITVSGFSEGDVAPYSHKYKGCEDATEKMANALGLETEINIWQVVTSSLVIMGYNKGDFILVDAKASVLARPSDVVLVQVYDRQSDNATILLRRFEPPVVVAASPDPDVQLVHVVDNKNVCILGVVTASWRVSKKRNAMCSQF